MDDIRKNMSAIRKGTVYTNFKLTHCPEKEAADQYRSPERKTADILVEIMNEHMPGIKFTSEIREDFPDEWGLPTLDTVMRMEEKGDVVGRMRRLQYRFYRKPMATDLVTDYHSANSRNSKIATLTQDVYRIMSNCSPETTVDERSAHLEEFIRRLRLSHYPPRIMEKIISNCVVTYKRALEREKRKERNLHRLGEEGLVE